VEEGSREAKVYGLLLDEVLQPSVPELISIEVNALPDSCACFSKQEIQLTTCGKSAGNSLRGRKAMMPTVSARAPPKRTQRKANCETIRHSDYGCGINKGNAKKRLISYIAEARCTGCAIHKKNTARFVSHRAFEEVTEIIKVVSTRTSRLPLFELVAGTKLQGFSGHALLREQLWQRLR